jgi:hypothetical protein
MTKLLKHFILRVWTDGGEHYQAPDYFRVSLSAEDLERYLGIYGIVLELEERMKGEPRDKLLDFHFLACWDYRASFFGRPDVNEQDQERLEALLDHADNEECVEISGDDALFIDSLMEDHEGFEEGGFQRMDYVYARFDKDGLHWEGCVKHCDYQVSTARLPWKALGVEGEPVKE